MLALANASVANNTHVVDWSYRFASWAFDDANNVALWVNDTDELIAWADARALAVVNTRFGRPLWFINVMIHQHERMRGLEAMGFANHADVDKGSWSNVLMALSPLPFGERLKEGASRPTPNLPLGFTICPLDGEREVDGYVALHRAVFESESMTAEWRRRTLAQPGYTPDLDLVLVAQDGSLCGFCVCWLDGDSRRGQVEPMGIRADMQGKGLGKMLLSEGLRRLSAHSATEIFVETNNFRNAALVLYESVGFRVRHDILVYRKDY